MKSRKCNLLLLTAIFFCLPACAQFAPEDNFKFKTYTTRDGLVHNFTIKSRMDSRGFLWIITQNGLSRFDGYQFKNFQHLLNDSNSLPFNELLDITIDKKDRVWLAYGKGLCCYDQSTRHFYLLNAMAVSLCFDSIHNKIWFNNSKGLFWVDPASFQISPSALQVKYPNRPAFTNIDSKHRLFISIERYGYYVYDTNNDSFRYCDNFYWPRNIKEDIGGNVWINTWGNGFQQFNESDGLNKGMQYQLPEKQTTDYIYQDATQSLPLTGPDIIWVAMHTDGIALFNKKTKKFIKWFNYDPAAKSGIATAFNSSIYTDPNGIIWICTWKGLTKVNKQEQQFKSAELAFLQSKDYNLLSAVFDDPADDRYAWVGVNGSGICYFDKTKQVPVKWYYKNYKTADDATNYNWRWITNGLQDKQQQTWFTTYGGLLKASGSRLSKVPLQYNNDLVYPAMARLGSDGFIWVCSSNGIIKLNPATNQYQVFRQSKIPGTPESYFDITEINEREMICASDRGLYLFNKTTLQFSHINIKETDSAHKEWNIFYTIQRIKDKIYAGTNSGLLMYDPATGNSAILGKEEEIFKLQFYSLIADAADNLWIYTLHGLFRYNPARNEFKKFTSADGIYDNSTDPVQLFNYHGNIFIGYRMAYTSFDPLQVDVNKNSARPFITDIIINKNPNQVDALAGNDHILQLDPGQNNIEFGFTAIDYTNSEKITFACMLEGFDKDWVFTGINRKINYANLKSGSYVFKVKACNSSGIWNEQYSLVKFYVKPSIWQRWWFWPLISTLFIALVILIAAKRIAAIKEKEKQKTAVNKMLAELETKMLRSQMNPHFIFNSLNSVQKYIWENREEDAAEYLSSFAKLIRAILENSRKEYITLKEEIEVVKLYIELEHRRSNAHFDYSVQVEDSLDMNSILIPPLLMQPFIENAIWHGLNKKPEKGNLDILVFTKNSQLICVIDDDGVGRTMEDENPAIQKKSLGIEITRQRISHLMEMTGQLAGIEIEDKKKNNRPAGTKVTIFLPLQK